MARGLTPRSFLLYGLLAGLLAGLAAFAVAWLAGERYVDAAIALEEAAAAHVHSHGGEEAPLVSREIQSTIGLLTGSLVIGTVLGGITGLFAALAMGRLGTLRAAASTAVVALLGFIGVGLVPFLKYPANPPAVGDPETINSRTALYFGFMVLSVVVVIVAAIVAPRLVERFGGFGGIVLTALGALGALVLAGELFAVVDEVAADFPASLLWQFRQSSLFTLATLWAGIGIVLTGLVLRKDKVVQADLARRELAASL